MTANFTKYISRARAGAKKGVDAALRDLKNRIDLNTPIDTGLLLSNNTIESAVILGDKVAGSIFNDTEYAAPVENGVLGRVYNYRRNGGIFYSGVGAGMYRRSTEEMTPQTYLTIRRCFFDEISKG